MNLQTLLSFGRNPPLAPSAADDIGRLRDRLLNDALLWIAAVSVPALSLSISRVVTLGWRPLFLGQVVMVLIIWGIRQLLGELPGNAVSFAEPGSITLGVSLAPVPAEADRVWIRFGIEDTGVGIAPEER